MYTTNFLWMCQGYYRHCEGYTPDWPGMDSYRGQIVHPQTWPEDRLLVWTLPSDSDAVIEP